MNHKLSAFLSAALVCATSVFADEIASEDGSSALDSAKHLKTAVQVGIATPVQWPDSSCDVGGLRFSFFYGESRNVTGLDLSFVGYTRESFSGLSLDGFSWVGGAAKGVQLGLVGNINVFDTCGIMLAGGVNDCRSVFTGVQFGLVNIASQLSGIQVGAANWDIGFSRGVQLGLINVESSDFVGCSFGAVNCTDSFVGVQAGLLNIATKSGRGLQLGLFNAADRYIGVQVGLLNLIGNANIPVFPFVNAKF